MERMEQPTNTMEYNFYTLNDLLQHTTIDKVKQSLTHKEGIAYIRLFNSREAIALVPSIFPNILRIKKIFNGYDNIRYQRYEYINSKPTGNRKTELIVQSAEDLTMLGLLQVEQALTPNGAN